MSRDHVLHRIRTATGRSAGQPCAEAPAPLLQIPGVDMQARIQMFAQAIESLAGKFHRAPTPEAARAYAAALIPETGAIASPAPLLADCGITQLPGVETGITERRALRAACARAGLGITSADYALADTGTLVMLSSPREARMISLLPPVHLAVVSAANLLTGLDELFTVLPDPAAATSAMVLITGPSRTADIEQILVRGVHGPGEIHVVLV